MTLETTELHPLFAVRVNGLDIRAGVDDRQFEALRDAFEEYSVVVLPEQALNDELQMAFSARFGPLETMLPHAANNANPSHISRMYNSEPDGSIIDPTDQRMVYLKANQIWHTDSSFKPIPSLCSLLHAREVPPKGGETEFASMRAAYAALDDVTKLMLDGKIALHHAARTRDMTAPGLVSDERRARPAVRHAMVRANPVNGRRALYAGGHAGRIEDMDEAESTQLLDQLMAHATQARFVYTHQWQVGDLVIWDNRAVLHRGRPWQARRYRRTLHRTTVAGSGPTVGTHDKGGGTSEIRA